MNSSTLWWRGLSIVTLVAILVSLSSISLHPLESHEAFVLVAAQAMHDHQDWVVPWFNGEYRLTKPPMNYWVTAFIAWVMGGVNDIQPWHARAVSALSGVGIVLLTAFNGRKLFDPATGLLASLMLATSSGFFYYTHSARPEMLYAFFCGLALTAYIYARDAALSSTMQKINSNLVWFAFALATLTKGPQLPAMFLIAFVVDCRLRNLTTKQQLTLLQPISGLLVFTLVALPWWLLLHYRVPASAIANSQISGTLLSIDFLKAINPYYLYRPFQLMLPWLFFIPALLYLFRDKLKNKNKSVNVFLLVLLFVLPVIMLSFGPQKRWYYMMPSLMPMFLLLSAGMVGFVRAGTPDQAWVKGLVYLFVLIPISCIVVVNTSYVLSKERMAEQRLAKLAYEQVKLGRRLITFGVSPQIYIYFTKHPVISVGSNKQLLTVLNEKPQQPILLVIQTKEVERLPKTVKIEVIQETRKDDNTRISLLQIN